MQPHVRATAGRHLVRIQRAPFLRIWISFKIIQLHIPPAIETESKTTLTRPAVPVIPLPQPIADMIIHFALIHKRAIPVEGFSRFKIISRKLIHSIVGDALGQIRGLSQQGVYRQRIHHFPGMHIRHLPGHRSCARHILGHPVVHVRRKIKRRIILIRHPHRMSQRIGRRDTIPDQRPVDLPRNDHRIRAVPRHRVAGRAVVDHGNRDPAARSIKGWIQSPRDRWISRNLSRGQRQISWNISTWGHQLVM